MVLPRLDTDDRGRLSVTTFPSLSTLGWAALRGGLAAGGAVFALLPTHPDLSTLVAAGGGAFVATVTAILGIGPKPPAP